MGAGPSKRSSNGGVGRRHSWAAQGNSRSLYKSFGGSFNQLRCVMHDFGSQNKCRSENYIKQKGTGAMVGLHSNWIGDVILACARPSDRIIQDHHLIHQVSLFQALPLHSGANRMSKSGTLQNALLNPNALETLWISSSIGWAWAYLLTASLGGQFRSQNIGTVINLQEPGEHAGCGDGVIPETGFSYNPELFMQDNTRPSKAGGPEAYSADEAFLYFNFPWKSSAFMDEKLTVAICQTVGTQISVGEKVAVHCHSGIGRTGLFIACYLLYSGEHDASMEAIQAVRQDRPGTLQSKSQVQLVRRFHNYIMNLRIQFVPTEQRRKSLTHRGMKSYPTLVESMVRQNELLYGMERHALHYVPKVLDWLTRDLIRRTEFDRDKREQIAMTFMRAFTTDLSVSPDDEFVQIAKARVNVGDWSGVEELDTSVLCHLLLEWLYQLQEPIVVDSVLTTALGRGDIESAIDELSKCDQCSFATLQCLVCWMFQMVPAQPKIIRRLYSALAHILLANTTLQNDRPSPQSFSPGDSSPERHPNTVRRHTVNRMYNVYTKYKPSLLEIEFGLLLEASARFWIKLGVASHEEIETQNKQAVNIPPGPSTAPMPSSLGLLALKLRDKHRLGSFSQPWFRDRASLQYEQYNPGKVMEYQREMNRGSIGEASQSPVPSHFAGQKPKPVIQKGEQKLKGVVQEETQNPVQQEQRKKAVPPEGKERPLGDNWKSPAAHQENKKPVIHRGNKKSVTHQENKKPLAPEEKKKPVVHDTKKKQVVQQEKKKPVLPEQKKPVGHEEKKVKGIQRKPI